MHRSRLTSRSVRVLRVVCMAVLAGAVTLVAACEDEPLLQPEMPRPVAQAAATDGTGAYPISDWIYNPATEHYYARVTEPMNNWHARWLADQFGGYLVAINDAAEQAWLISQFGGEEYEWTRHWIGATDMPGRVWRWMSGDPFTYTAWCAGEPDGLHLGEPGSSAHAAATHLREDGCLEDLRRADWINLAIIETPAVTEPSTTSTTGVPIIDLGPGFARGLNATSNPCYSTVVGMLLSEPTGDPSFGLQEHPVLWENFSYGAPVDLGAGDNHQASDINARGQVAGGAVIGQEGRAFLWENGRLTELTGGYHATDSHADGWAVGSAASDPRQALVWYRGDQYSLPIGDGAWAVPSAVRESGAAPDAVVGFARIGPGGEQRAVLWTGEAPYFDEGIELGTLGGGSRAGDIDVFYNVVGVSGGHAFFATTDPLELIPLGRGHQSHARAIDSYGPYDEPSTDHTLVAGWYIPDLPDEPRAIVWQPIGGDLHGWSHLDLGTLEGHNRSEAHDVNRWGFVVGVSGYTWGGRTPSDRAVVWAIPGTMAAQYIGQCRSPETEKPKPPPKKPTTPVSQVIDLGTFGGASVARGVNNDGLVVGGSETSSGEWHAFYWNKKDDLTDIGTLDPALQCVAWDVNENGEAVGWCRSHGAGEHQVFSWRKGTDDLIVPIRAANHYCTDPLAFAISYDFEMVGGCKIFYLDRPLQAAFNLRVFADVTPYESGWSVFYDVAGRPHQTWVGAHETAAGATRAMLSKGRGPLQDLGTLGGDWSEAHGINERGEIVGGSTTASGETHAFLWTEKGGMVDLGTLGGDHSIARAINRRGQVVGESKDFYGRTRAFLWTAKDGMLDLGALEGDDTQAAAADINDNGQVVGESEVGPDRKWRAVMWKLEREKI